MRKNKMLKVAISAVLTTCMVAGMIPMTMGGIFGTPMVTSAAEEGTVNPLTTIWKTSEIGTHEGTGSYNYDAETNKITIDGAGTKFDKGTGSDDLFYAYFSAKGDITITAKMSVENPDGEAGYAGLLIRNAADEAGSASAAVYADMANGSKNQIRYGYHKESAGGGAAQVNANVTTESTDIYIKLEVSGTKATYSVASQADFSDAAIKAQNIDGMDAKTVGFFATKGIKATYSDVQVTSKYEVDGTEVKKLIFDSEVGELIPSMSSSKDYSGTYVDTFSFDTKVDGNELQLISTRGGSDKAEIRSDKSVNYLLFPALAGNYRVSADIAINSINSGTDKQGVAVGQFSGITKKTMEMDIVQANKNWVTQHNFTTIGGGVNGGDPKTASNEVTAGNTYNLSYEKTDAGSVMITKSASGKVLADNSATPFDLTQAAQTLQAGTSVCYGLAVAAADVTISNLTLFNSDGVIVYDQNDYYIAVGVAPSIENVSATVAEDRNSIGLAWDITAAGSGNVSYSVYVSKNNGEYVLAGVSKVNSFNYALTEDGTYKFKVVPKGGETIGTEIVSLDVVCQLPLASTQMEAVGTAEQIALSWTKVEGAVSYDVYKAHGSNGEFSKVTSTKELSYVDKAVIKEEPYYYYIIAKNDTNTSNPSTTMQVLVSDGHTGEYVYENEATKLTITAKSNDTVFSNDASVTMKADEAGTATLNVNGTKTETKSVSADAEFTFDIKLMDGRNDVEVLFTDAQGNTTRKVFNFVANPVVDIYVDSAYTGVDGAILLGLPTYKTVQAAVNAVAADNDDAKVIFIKNGEYNERIEVKAPNVNLLGEDAEKTHLFAAVSVSDKSATGMWDRNAMYVDSTADGFSAENLSIENSFRYTNGSDQQADALCIVADQTICVNVRLIGYQDTLLTDSRVKDETGAYEVTRQYFEKCYITGNVDFIYGAGTSVFEDCDIVARYTEYKADGCYTAGRTYATTEYGYVFNNCRFLAEDGVADRAYRMARPWGADDSTTFINCYLGRAIDIAEGKSYGDMSGNMAANARFAEYGSYGPGYTVNNTRPYLTAAQAATFASATVMGDFDYTKKLASLYTVKTETPDQVEVKGDAAKDVVDIEISEDAEIKNEAGEIISPADVVLEIKNISEERKAELEEMVKNSDMKLPEKAVIKFYDINLLDKNGSVVKLSNGKVRITLAEDTTIDYSKVDVLVYHIMEDGKIEQLEVTVVDGKATFETSSFSPYMIVYRAKAEESTETPATGDTSGRRIYLFLAIMAFAMIGLVYASRKKRRG